MTTRQFHSHRSMGNGTSRRQRAVAAPARQHDFNPAMHQRGQSRETGAVLILALLVLTAVSLIVLALLGWVGTSLNASGVFSSERSVESAATSAVDLAIQNSRYTFSTAMENASPPVPCWTENGSAPTILTVNNQTIYVWCSMLWQPFSAQTRTITYSACLSTATTDAATCAAAPLLQAIETYDDYPPGIGTPSSGPVQCNLTSFCGQSQTQDSWAWHPTVPSVTSVSPSSGQITGINPSTGHPLSVTITGNGFVNGASVNFVQETGPSPPSGTANVPTNANGGAGVIVSATVSPGSESCAGPNDTNCTISLSAPAVVSGSSGSSSSSNPYYYFVTVTTPGGTSAYVPTPGSTSYNVFQYWRGDAGRHWHHRRQSDPRRDDHRGDHDHDQRQRFLQRPSKHLLGPSLVLLGQSVHGQCRHRGG